MTAADERRRSGSTAVLWRNRSQPAATVLIVNDEDPVRRLLRHVFEAAGYSVFEAATGYEALSLLEGRGHFDLLVADLQMPDMRGDEMARQFRLSRPDLKVLYVTGFADRLFDARGSLLEGEAFLEKPFTPGGLMAAASALMGKHVGGRSNARLNRRRSSPALRRNENRILGRRRTAVQHASGATWQESCCHTSTAPKSGAGGRKWQVCVELLNMSHTRPGRTPGLLSHTAGSTGRPVPAARGRT